MTCGIDGNPPNGTRNFDGGGNAGQMDDRQPLGKLFIRQHPRLHYWTIYSFGALEHVLEGVWGLCLCVGRSHSDRNRG